MCALGVCASVNVAHSSTFRGQAGTDELAWDQLENAAVQRSDRSAPDDGWGGGWCWWRPEHLVFLEELDLQAGFSHESMIFDVGTQILKLKTTVWLKQSLSWAGFSFTLQFVIPALNLQ